MCAERLCEISSSAALCPSQRVLRQLTGELDEDWLEEREIELPTWLTESGEDGE